MEQANNPFFAAPVEKSSNNKFISFLQGLAIFSIVLIVTWVVILEQSQVNGISMDPNFETGEFLLVSKIPKIVSNVDLATTLGLEYQRGDVVVFAKPGLVDFVKRVIGVPGDKVQIKNGKFYVNDMLMEEHYLDPSLYTNGGDYIVDNGRAIHVPEGHYILVGDNRPNSNDSRFGGIGLVKREWIKGKVFIRIWPLDVFSFIGQGSYSLK